MEVFIEFYNPALHFYDRLKALQTFQSWVINKAFNRTEVSIPANDL